MSFDDSIIYLEDTDFKGNTLYYNGRPVTAGFWFIMIQASYCGYCTKSKPAFAKAAAEVGSTKLNSGVIFATVHSDSKNQSERNMASVIQEISGIKIQGITAFLLYDAKSHQFKLYDGDRSASAMIAYLNKHV
jgi:thiol-disulfide isomerase/thioredoxin